MAKKKTNKSSPSTERPKQRSDADRRARQSERLSRVLRVLQCIMGPGRWDAESLARELECSTRTIHRILQTLSMSNVPWFFCKKSQCYRVRPGFRFPGIDGDNGTTSLDAQSVLAAAEQLLKDSEQLVDSLRQFCDTMRNNEIDDHAGT